MSFAQRSHGVRPAWEQLAHHYCSTVLLSVSDVPVDEVAEDPSCSLFAFRVSSFKMHQAAMLAAADFVGPMPIARQSSVFVSNAYECQWMGPQCQRRERRGQDSRQGCKRK